MQVQWLFFSLYGKEWLAESGGTGDCLHDSDGSIDERLQRHMLLCGLTVVLVPANILESVDTTERFRRLHEYHRKHNAGTMIQDLSMNVAATERGCADF